MVLGLDIFPPGRSVLTILGVIIEIPLGGGGLWGWWGVIGKGRGQCRSPRGCSRWNGTRWRRRRRTGCTGCEGRGGCRGGPVGGWYKQRKKTLRTRIMEDGDKTTCEQNHDRQHQNPQQLTPRTTPMPLAIIRHSIVMTVDISFRLTGCGRRPYPLTPRTLSLILRCSIVMTIDISSRLTGCGRRPPPLTPLPLPLTMILRRRIRITLDTAAASSLLLLVRGRRKKSSWPLGTICICYCGCGCRWWWWWEYIGWSS